MDKAYYSRKQRDQLENFFDKARLSLQDSDFLRGVESDIKSFAEGPQEKRALVFPPVSNYRRFLIHELVNEHFPNLKTFSIGGGEARRPVLCFKSDYIQPQITKPKVSDETSSDRSTKSSETCPTQPKRERRTHAMPSITIYRPPPARRLEDQASSNKELEPLTDSINRRQTGKYQAEAYESLQKTKKNDFKNMAMFRNAISSIRTQNQGSKCKSADAAKKAEPSVKSTQGRVRRPDMEVYIPKGRRMLIDQQRLLKEDSAMQNEVDSVKDNEKAKKNVPDEINSCKNSEKVKNDPEIGSDINGGKNTEQPEKSPVQSCVNGAKNIEKVKNDPEIESDINCVKNDEKPKKPAAESDDNSAKDTGQPEETPEIESEVNSGKNTEQPEKSPVQSCVNGAKNSEKVTKIPIESGVNGVKNDEEPKIPAAESDVNSAKDTEQLEKSPVQSCVNGAKNIEQPEKTLESGMNGIKNDEEPKKPAAESDDNSAKDTGQPEKSPVQSCVNGANNSQQPKKSPVQSYNNCTTNSEIQKKPVQNEFHSGKKSEEQKKSRQDSEHLEPGKKECERSSVYVKNTGLNVSRMVNFEAKRVYPVSPSSLWIEAQNEVEDAVAKKVSSLSGNNGSDSNTSKSSLEKICDKKAMNPEECDWETMFDDSGECLDPSLMEQLSSAVGAVTIEKPKSNYDAFRTKTLDLVGDEFPHVVEIYNFPPEFCHQDLVVVFSQFKNAGFEIKWVDDTHALGIFSNAQIVSEVLALRHPFVKTRLLKDGTVSSRAKARRFAEQLLPYKPRPDTCPALARRLVTGALGVRLPTSREEREAERKILSEAREKKRLEARQREEAWEGTFH